MGAGPMDRPQREHHVRLVVAVAFGCLAALAAFTVLRNLSVGSWLAP